MGRKTLSRVSGMIDGAHPARSILRLLARRPGRISVAVLAFALKEVPLWFLPVVTAAIIDIVADDGEVSQVAWWFAVAAVLLLQNYPNHIVYTRNFMTVVRDTGADLRNALAAHLQSLSIGYHSRTSSSLVQTKVVRDVENVELMLQQVTHPLLSAIMVMAGALSMTAVAVPQFLPVYALAVPIAIGIRYGMRNRSRARNETFRREVEVLSSRVGEMASLIPVTRAHGLEETAVTRVAHGADGVRRAGLHLDMLNGHVASISWVAMQLLGVGCLVLAALFSLTGVLPITPGEVVLLSTYFTLLTQGLTQLLMLIPVGARGLESVRSIAEVLQEPDLELNEGRDAVADVSGEIDLHAASHRYAGAGDDALHRIDLRIPAGATVAFVGSSGSGKSTMLNLVLGFLRPTSGRILLDGRDMQELDLRTVRRFVSVVPQESVLFEGTIRENVAYGLRDVDDARIERALRDANAWQFVQDQPHGWDTVVGERGARLSGGQRQRLAIARALVRDPRILLLDEATSALDPESEELVKDALGRLMQGRTTLVVAHRLSTVRQADTIVVLEGGRIVEQGSHAELLERGGRYAHLHLTQAGLA
ncbi:ABC transporter ATP-binding protein/permease [Microbacterium sp. EYE_5]|uniref:ABC transporter ATP-binding protein n=1 Tax=unclassified Microbacterium TaxID=2609290 RepID=UPI0020040A58|nr:MULTISPECIES: ABC transporter ATP-binding protein [unclassified Microbacterium]MCK6079274.1 ABC transporter ATP-binding protein/permease [Microbacterium sp. EYE_382]MCK6084544.1 ABC transporter ATP-binding protein/permease [Microbacterium sp. EYE_384]MCK6123227.1 ABC transporter ATP-binding protein/permease [Microbacterium sp. EYE_80]MCK6125308.1 ABC transporter ATP-binding protein/permease [Microbacterium sp. EYE_79]MCK6140228.1 ABC transporter ATP-binding protein/permease [Microbacterium 